VKIDALCFEKGINFSSQIDMAVLTNQAGGRPRSSRCGTLRVEVGSFERPHRWRQPTQERGEQGPHRLNGAG